ncbi:MAG: hypothetical protein WDN27_00520 [Candidatus Saccharibacteria bacterium]
MPRLPAISSTSGRSYRSAASTTNGEPEIHAAARRSRRVCKASREKANLAQTADAGAEDLGDAAADVFTVLLDICNHIGIDLDAAFIKREQKNQTRTWE